MSLNFPLVIKQTEKIISDNLPLILTAVGAVGAVGTAVLSGRAGYKAGSKMTRLDFMRSVKESETDEKQPEPSRTEVFSKTWKMYIVPGVITVGTIACVVGAQYINARRLAALGAAYILLERNAGEYKDKVLEKVGLAKADKIDQAIAQDKVDATPASKIEALARDENKALFMDMHSVPAGNVFASTRENIDRAVNALNAKFLDQGEVTLNDYYRALGQPCDSDLGNKMKWPMHHGELLDMRYEPLTNAKTGIPITKLRFSVDPTFRPD